MKIEEAIKILREGRYTVESSEFTVYDKRRFGKHVKATHDSNVKNGRDEVEYEDDKRYNDSEGIKWLDVKKRDAETLKSAIIDGIVDSGIDHEPKNIIKLFGDEEDLEDPQVMHKKYINIRSHEDLNKLYNKNKVLVDTIIRFLQKYMHGKTTVYRGFSIPNEIYNELRQKHSVRFDVDMLRYLNNRTKKFNSFSVSPIIAKGFAEDVDYSKNKAVIISAEVEPNDISFAFTAYLMGRHGGIGEFELNINNLKDLFNLRLIRNIDAECKRYYNTLISVEKLQKQLDSGKEINSVFDEVDPMNSYNKSQFLCVSGDGCLVVRDNKIVTPRFRSITELANGIYAVKQLNSDKECLYKEGDGQISKEYDDIAIYNNAADDRFLIVKVGDLYQLINKQTGKELFKAPLKKIERAPGNLWYNAQSIWHTREFYILTGANNKKTMINGKTGRAVFKNGLVMFENIEIDPYSEKLEFDGWLNKSIVKHYIISSEYAIEKM